MKGSLIVVSATGTGVGKTHVATALLRAWASTGVPVCGYKPVETGVTGDEGDDGRALRLASSFHVKPTCHTYRDPVSPHLAARREGRPIHLERIADETDRLCSMAAGVVLELAGGLFSPLSSSDTCADLVRLLGAQAHLLVAPDRLGVLHDVQATVRAALTNGTQITGVALSTPETRDASTGTNANEIMAMSFMPVLGVLPRASAETLANGPVIARLLSTLTPHR